jgi:formylmethanofuran dehydrogenase subunit E-like metal-binding protein
MKKLVLFSWGLLFLFNVVNPSAATDLRYLIRESMNELKVEKGSPELCALTDATYVKLKGKTTEEYVDIIQQETGSSIGRGNLLFFHRPVGHPLIIAIHRKDTGEAIVIMEDSDGANKIRFNIKGDTAADPKHYGEIMKMLKGDTFSIVTILTAHAKGAPYDFLKCCEYHNHYCPGVTSGYFIAKLISERYPVGPGEQYIWFACPPWCKDDAISTILDLTPGKRNLYVTELAEGQPTEGFKGRWAGIMALWNSKKEKGKAIALQFDWNEAYKLAGLKEADLNPQGGPSNPAYFTARIKSSWSLIPHLDQPGKFVSVAKEVEITPSMLKRMKMAGESPYQVIGILK